MCPHYKLEWFRSRGYSESDVHRIESLANSTYEHVTEVWSEEEPENLKSDGMEHSDLDRVSRLVTFLSFQPYKAEF